MLEIHYLKNGSKEVTTVESPERFLASQYLEVPPFQDHYPVEEVFLDGKRITLIPTLRLKGDYLAIATLGVAEIIRILLVNLRGLTNGPAGIFGLPQFSNWQIVFLFAVLSILVVSNFIHSGPGRATLAIREDEIAAESMGVNTTKYKVIAFVMGAVMASIAGTLYASYQQSVFPRDYGFMKSIDVLIIVVFGGLGSTTGAVVSAVVLGILNMYLQGFSDLRMIIYALALIIIAGSGKPKAILPIAPAV